MPRHGGGVRWSLPLLLCACAGPLPSEPQPDGPCAETVQPLRSGDRTPWGTTPSAIRVIMDSTTGTWTDATSTDLTVELAWPSGFTALIWAEAASEPDVAPPLWCTDRVQLPAEVRWVTADGRFDVDGEPVEIQGDLRAVGPFADLELGFAGRIGADVLPALVPDGVDPTTTDLLVWVWWERGEALSSTGQVRLAPRDGGETDVGEIVGGWE